MAVNVEDRSSIGLDSKMGAEVVVVMSSCLRFDI